MLSAIKKEIKTNNFFKRAAKPGSVLQLAFFRILIGCQIFYSSQSQLFYLLQTVKGTKKPTIIPDAIDLIISEMSVHYLKTIVNFLSVFLIFGLFTRIILPILTIAYILLFSFWYSKFDAPIPWLYIWFPLIVLCFSKCSDALSLDRLLNRTTPINKTSAEYRWPMEMIVVWLVYIYFASGIAKLVPFQKGLIWFNGATSQNIIYSRFLDSVLYFVFGKPFFDYSSHSYVFSILSLFAVLIELLTIVLLLTDKLNIVILFLLISMHFFLYLVGVPAFMQLSLILGISLISPQKFNSLHK